VTAVWLWNAPGPASSWSGITDDEQIAKDCAAALLSSGAAVEAVIEEARIAFGAVTLADCYQRTGRRWRAAAGESVRWHAEAA
jgi:hypothetical protein